MTSVSITLNFPSLEAAADALAAMTPRGAPLPVIAAADRPDAGQVADCTTAAAPTSPLTLGEPVNPFRSGAPSTAVAGAPSIAPVAPLATSPTPAAVFAPPAPIAPTVAVPPAPAGLTTPALDGDGLPWDARIHSKPPTANSDGRWRQKRSLNDPALKLRIETELRQAMAAHAPSTVPVVSAAPVVPPALPVTTAPSQVAPVAPMGETFGQVMGRLAPRMGDPAGSAAVNQALAMFKLTGLGQLAARPDLVAGFAASVDALLAQVPA